MVKNICKLLEKNNIPCKSKSISIFFERIVFL